MEQSIINITPLNPNLSECHIKVLYHGLNRNKSYISKTVAENLANKLPGTPIVGMYINDKEDFDDHGERLVMEDGSYSIKKMTKPFGFVKQDTKVWWQKFNENGQEKDYMMCEGYVWTDTYPEVKRVIEKGNWQSMEFMPDSLKGEWTQMNHEVGKQKPMFMVEDADFRALCILGEDVEPCFETAAIGAPGSLFMLNNSNELESDFSQIKYNIEKSLEEGGSKVPEVDNTNVTESSVEVEAPVEAPVTEVEEEVVAEEETVEETPVEEAAPEQGDEEQEEPVQESEPEEEEAEGPTQESEEVPAEPENDVQTELADLQAKLAESVKALEELKNQFALANEELTTLRALKADIDTKAKEAMFAKFYMLDAEDIKPIQEKSASLSVEDIEKELSVVAFRKKVNFSLLDEEEETDEVITSFNANVEDTIPAWLRVVEDIKKNRN